MGFKIENFTADRGTFNSNSRTNSPAVHRYLSTEDNLATVSAEGYFDGVKEYFIVKDSIIISASDEQSLSEVQQVDPTVKTVNTEAVLPDNSVGTAQLQDGAVTTPKVANLAITNPKLGLLSVATGNLQDASVSNAKLGGNSVDTANVIDNAIIQQKINSLAVGTAQLQEPSVTTAKVTDLAITNPKIANLAVDEAKLAATVTDRLPIASGIYDLTNVGVPGEVVAIPGKGLISGMVCNCTTVVGSTGSTQPEAIVGTDQITFAFGSAIVLGDRIQYTVHKAF